MSINSNIQRIEHLQNSVKIIAISIYKLKNYIFKIPCSFRLRISFRDKLHSCFISVLKFGILIMYNMKHIKMNLKNFCAIFWIDRFQIIYQNWYNLILQYFFSVFYCEICCCANAGNSFMRYKIEVKNLPIQTNKFSYKYIIKVTENLITRLIEEEKAF